MAHFPKQISGSPFRKRTAKNQKRCVSYFCKKVAQQSRASSPKSKQRARVWWYCRIFSSSHGASSSRRGVVHQSGEFIDRQAHGVPGGVDGGAPLPHPVAEGGVPGVLQLFGHGVNRQNGRAGLGHLHLSHSPEPGGFQSLPGPGVGGIPPGELLHRLFRAGQRPGHRRSPVYLFQLLLQREQAGVAGGKEDFVFPFLPLFHFNKVHGITWKERAAQTSQPGSENHIRLPLGRKA